MPATTTAFTGRRRWHSAPRRGTINNMHALALFFSTSGRLAPRPFAAAATLVYAVGLVSQALISAPVPAGARLWPFAVVQAALIWGWYALHAKRLRDAERGPEAAAGIAVICALAVVLLLLVLAFFADLVTGADARAGGSGLHFIGLFGLLYLVGILPGSSGISALTVVLAAFVVIAFLPVLLALGFSIWTATRPRAAP